MPDFSLAGRTALVTGGNGGIGRGIALGLAEAGANVAIAARNQDKSTTVASEIRALGARALPVPCDVTKRADIESAVAQATDHFGGLDVLVNNAGVGGWVFPLEIDDDLWDRVHETNLKAPLHFAQVAHPALAASGGGTIINVASIAANYGTATQGAYGSSKAALIQLTGSLAAAFARDDIRVNAIVPGSVNTDMTAGAAENEARYRHLMQRTPMRRFGEPEEFGGVAVFLASAASSYMTGQTVVIDGGFSLL
jgi:2-deoxy-D-gluconate 3-dehydrogenase